MIHAARCLALIAVAGAATSVAHAQMEQVLESIRGDGAARIIVKLKTESLGASWERSASVAEQKALVDRAVRTLEAGMPKGVEVETTLATLPFVGMTVDEQQVLDLVAMDGVAGVYLNRIERKAETATVRESASLASSLPSIDLADAWAKGYEGKDVTVAVIDGGFRVTHPMLRGKNVGDACFSDNDPDTKTTTRCPSGMVPEYGAGAASNCPDGSNRCDHGTHVASIAVGNDGTANYGVARAAKLMPIDVFSEVNDVDDCSPDPAPCELTDSLTVLKALDYINQRAAEFKVVAVNLSLGGGANSGPCDNDPRREVVEMLRRKGVATVAASGNEGLTGKINAPACITQSVAVGATNDGTSVASFSNFASTVDLMAPGVSIRAASGRSDGLVTLQGTSMASPQVAGAFAVLRSASPKSTVDEMERALRLTGIKTTRADSDVFVSKIQVNRALLRLQGRDRREFANVLSSTAGDASASESYLRFHNKGSTAGTVSVSLLQAENGRVIGSWTSGNIPAHASAQFNISNLEKEARAATTSQPIPAATGSFYNLRVESTFRGYMQHIVWARGAGVLTNLSACNDGLAADNSVLMNVHTSALSEYPSRIRIANSGAVSDSAELTFYAATTGRQIGTWITPSVPAGGSIEVTIPRIEALSPELAAAVADGVAQVNVNLGSLTGYMQHVVQNSRSGVLLDLSPKCELGASE